MFEKEAEDYALRNIGRNDLLVKAFKGGAEFGYNKTNEWHYVENDLPDNSRTVWTNVGAGYHDDDGWWDDFGRLQGVLAWCEPKFLKR